jgi:hypothetical protein
MDANMTRAAMGDLNFLVPDLGDSLNVFDLLLFFDCGLGLMRRIKSWSFADRVGEVAVD